MQNQRAALYWVFQSIAEPESEFADENIKQSISDMIAAKPYFQWNERAKDYHITAAIKEHDRLCFFIEKETGQNAQNMDLYRFLATLENLVKQAEEYGKH